MTGEQRQEQEQEQDVDINPWAAPSSSSWAKPIQLPPPVFGDDSADAALLLLPGLDIDLQHPLDLYIPPLLQLDVEPFTVGPLEQLDALSHASRSERSDTPLPDPSSDQDIWSIACRLGSLKDDRAFLTWETFANPNPFPVEPRPAFISEAGPAAFDAALTLQAQDSHGLFKPGRVLQSDAFLKSLSRLALGRPSQLFPYHDESNTFRQAIDDGRMSGYSLDSAQSLVDDVLDLANATAALRQFSQHTYASASPLPSMVAMASAVQVALCAVEEHLVPYAEKSTSLLQLQDSMQRPQQIIHTLKELVDRIANTDSDGQVISNVFDKLHSCEDSGEDIGFIFRIFERVSGPWVDTTMERVGLSYTQRFGSPIDSLSSNHFAGTNLQPQQLPGFVSAEASRMIKNTEPCLAFLRDFHPTHPLVNLHSSGIKTPRIEWGFDWDDLHRIAEKAEQYHQSLASAVADFNVSGLPLSQASMFEPSEESAAVNANDWPCLDLDLSLDNLAASPKSLTSATPDELSTFVATQLSSNSDASLAVMRPPVSSMVHLSLKPMLSVQHAMLTTATLRCILLDHDLHEHLNILHSFHLCSSGIFASHLAMVLFSSDVEAAERTKGVLRTGAGTMGLKLGSGQRREWPPASSEVTLALMNVLHKSWRPQSGKVGNDLRKSTATDAAPQGAMAGDNLDKRSLNLPGGLSFAIRNDVTEDEIQQILDPQGIFALDFLRLSYTPPSALGHIFTRSSLEKYDRIFKLLLRMLRIQFVIGELFRNTLLSSRNRRRGRMRRPHRPIQEQEGQGAGDEAEQHLAHVFRHRATHFVTTLCSHFLTAGISRAWQQLLDYISALESHVSASSHSTLTLPPENSGYEQLTQEFSLSRLVHVHEATLTRIATSLLLRNQQRKLASALELVLDDILAFAFLLQRQDLDIRKRAADVEALYTKFDAHMVGFKDALAKACAKGQSSGEHNHQDGLGTPPRNDSGGVETLQELLERL